MTDMISCHSPVKPLPLWRLVFVIRVHDDLFASEVDDLVEVQSRHVHFAGEEDGAVTCEGQSEQSGKTSVQSRLACIVRHDSSLQAGVQLELILVFVSVSKMMFHRV